MATLCKHTHLATRTQCTHELHHLQATTQDSPIHTHVCPYKQVGMRNYTHARHILRHQDPSKHRETLSQDKAASHPRRTRSSAILLWEPQSHNQKWCLFLLCLNASMQSCQLWLNIKTGSSQPVWLIEQHCLTLSLPKPSMVVLSIYVLICQCRL